MSSLCQALFRTTLWLELFYYIEMYRLHVNQHWPIGYNCPTRNIFLLVHCGFVIAVTLIILNIVDIIVIIITIISDENSDKSKPWGTYSDQSAATSYNAFCATVCKRPIAAPSVAKIPSAWTRHKINGAKRKMASESTRTEEQKDIISRILSPATATPKSFPANALNGTLPIQYMFLISAPIPDRVIDGWHKTKERCRPNGARSNENVQYIYTYGDSIKLNQTVYVIYILLLIIS